MSLEIDAAGCVESNIFVEKSSYSAAMSNDAILGICPELVYDSDCKVENVKLKFKLDEQYIPNEGSL